MICVIHSGRIRLPRRAPRNLGYKKCLLIESTLLYSHETMSSSSSEAPLESSPLFRVILADDHKVLRFGLKTILRELPGVEVVAEAGDGRELLEKTKSCPCDLVIMDLSMPRMDGLQALEAIHFEFPEIMVLIFSVHREKEFLRQALSRGVKGYLLKDDEIEHVLEAVRSIRAGGTYFSQDLTAHLVEDYNLLRDGEVNLSILTRREREILRLIAQGSTNREIASSLDISHRTVQTHRSHIMEKLHVKNTAGLVKFAVDNGLI